MARIVRAYSKDIQAVTKDLRGLQRQLKKMEKELQQELVDETAIVLGQNVEMIQDYDGNIDFKIEVTDDKVSFTGSQVAYLEYGTGLTGASNSKSPYQPSDYKHSDRREWYYKSKTTGLFKKSTGIPSFMPVFKTDNEMQQRKYSIAKRLIKEAIKNNDLN